MYGNGNYWDEPMIDLNNDGIGDIPFEYTSSLGDLIEDSDELAYLFLESPAVKVYEKINDILGNQDVMAIDDYPLLVERENNYFMVTFGFVVFLGLVIYFVVKKRRRKHEVQKLNYQKISFINKKTRILANIDATRGDIVFR